MQCEEWGTEARVIALRRGEDITVEEALARVLEVVTAGGRGPVLQAYWFAIFGWIAGRMTFEAHLGSLDASKTFISQETFIQESLVVLVLCSILILKRQQKQNIIWIDRFFLGERLLFYLLKRVGRSQRKCGPGRGAGLDMVAIVPQIMNDLVRALILVLVTARYLQEDAIQGHIHQMRKGIAMTPLLTLLYLGLPVQDDLQDPVHIQEAGRHLTVGPTLSHQIGVEDMSLPLGDVESDQDRSIEDPVKEVEENMPFLATGMRIFCVICDVYISWF